MTVTLAAADVTACEGFMAELLEIVREPFGLARDAVLDEPVPWKGPVSVGFAVL